VAQPFFTMILYDCNLKCLSYVYMFKLMYHYIKIECI